jgi:hypothetical protein
MIAVPCLSRDVRLMHVMDFNIVGGARNPRRTARDAEVARPPMTSPCKPNGSRPAMPAMPLARRGLENDSAPSEQAGDRPAMQRSMCW